MVFLIHWCQDHSAWSQSTTSPFWRSGQDICIVPEVILITYWHAKGPDGVTNGQITLGSQWQVLPAALLPTQGEAFSKDTPIPFALWEFLESPKRGEVRPQSHC